VNDVLASLSDLIKDTHWIAPLLALLAGILTSFTPCSLSTIPLIISVVGGTGLKSTKKSLYLSITFAVGSAITFTILGTLASLAGNLVGTSAKWWYLILGVLMVFMALQTWELYSFIPSIFLLSKNNKRGYIGALIAGILAGVFSSPCSTPVLIALLAIVAGKGSIVWGIVLLLLYSIGHAIISIVAGTCIGFVQKLTSSSQYGRYSKLLKIILGSIILMIALYMFYMGF